MTNEFLMTKRGLLDIWASDFVGHWGLVISHSYFVLPLNFPSSSPSVSRLLNLVAAHAFPGRVEGGLR